MTTRDDIEAFRKAFGEVVEENRAIVRAAMTTRDDLDPIEALQAERQAADPFRASMLARWPSLYAHLAEEPVRMCKPITREGFAIGKGWRPIVERLSAKLAALAELLPPEERALVHVDQVKEKFGRLRVYLDDVETDEMRAAIDTAQDESGYTCEDCGQPGTARTLLGCASTLCGACWDAVVEKRRREVPEFEKKGAR
jgi:hypothetical protein